MRARCAHRCGPDAARAGARRARPLPPRPRRHRCAPRAPHNAPRPRRRHRLVQGKGGVIESSFNFFGLLDEESSLNLMYTNSAILSGLVYSYLPLMVLPIYASMEKMDLRLLEAATDLYSNRIELIRKIILPLSMPGIIGGSILVFVPCLGAFIAPDLLGGGKKLLLGSLIQFQFSYARNWPFGAAMAMFLLALVILVLIFNARLNRKHREYANQK